MMCIEIYLLVNLTRRHICNDAHWLIPCVKRILLSDRTCNIFPLSVLQSPVIFHNLKYIPIRRLETRLVFIVYTDAFASTAYLPFRPGLNLLAQFVLVEVFLELVKISDAADRTFQRLWQLKLIFPVNNSRSLAGVQVTHVLIPFLGLLPESTAEFLIFNCGMLYHHV